ncbi:hypothetical protein RI367_008636 [Sorochytrium milnesiophthora]
MRALLAPFVLAALISSAVVQAQQCKTNSDCTAAGACCSQWGWCGVGPAWCGASSNSPAAPAPPPTVQPAKPQPPAAAPDPAPQLRAPQPPATGNGGSTTCPNGLRPLDRRVGYYASWSSYQSCTQFKISDIDTQAYTHIIFGFVSITSDFQLTYTEPASVPLYEQLRQAKAGTSLKTLVSVGGWSFNDPGPTHTRFSDLAASSNNRKMFAQSAISFMRKYGFDGIDIDWEFPTEADRGGKPEDRANLVLLMKDLREAFNRTPEKFLLTIAGPPGAWRVQQQYDFAGISRYVDWVNMMAYDFHGSWDVTSLLPHTAVQDVSSTLSAYLNAGVPASKLVMGLALYGHGYTAKSASCTHFGCPSTGVSPPTGCTQIAGSLSYADIQAALANGGGKATYDSNTLTTYASYGNGKYWVAYDDVQSMQAKLKFANDHCLGGVMTWSIDQDLVGKDSVFRRALTGLPQVHFAVQQKRN